MSTEHVDPELVEQTKQQIRNIVREIAQRHRATVELGPASARGGTRVGVVFPAG